MTDPNKIIKRRFRIIYALLIVFLLVVAGQFIGLQVGSGAELVETTAAKLVKTISLTGGRGAIYDKYGVALAYDESCYNITFYKPPGSNSSALRESYTKSIIKAIEIIEAEGGSVIDNFSIIKDENGDWALDFATTNPEVFEKRESQWRSNFYVAKVEDYPVAALFDTLCERYRLPEGLDYAMARKVMAVWQEMQMNAFLGNPIIISKDVSFAAVAKISAALPDCPGIGVAEDTKRVYPMDDVAAHVIGYMGKMQSDSIIKTYKELGYSASDTIGITGIEKTMEEHLSAHLTWRKGTRVVETDANGRVMRELDYTEPQDGDSVVLTIDLDLQKVLEDALIKNINATKQEQLAEYEANKDAYDALVAARGGSGIMYAESGGAIVMDVKNGNILALGSYPSYSLNLFSGGISTADYKALEEDSRAPLFNKAIGSKETPGSIFKMATSLAGLEEGVITPTETIDDDGRYKKYDAVNGPRCWTNYPHQHHDQTVLEAIKNSCNYFFYEVADRLGIDRLSDWTGRLGLTSKTNIELPGESTGVVGGQLSLYDSSKAINEQSVEKASVIARSIKNLLVAVGEDLGGRTYEEERLDRVVKMLMDLVNEYSRSESLEHIRNILLTEMGLTSGEISNRYMVNTISNYLQDLRWTPTQTLMTGIGQAITQVTPVSVARYISAIANGGTVYDAHIVDRIIDANGELVLKTEPVAVSDLTDTEDMLKIIRDGMKGVTSQEDGGTAWKYFVDYKYKDQIGAKTGTAQVSKIDLECHSWFVAFAPFDDPEIAVVVFIPNGYSGAKSYITIQDTIEYYLDKKAAGADEGVYAPGGLVP